MSRRPQRFCCREGTSHHSRRGLTLTEVLIVLAIVVVLAGLGLAIAPRAITAGQDRHCASNLRQLATALIAYAADHDDGLPAARLFSTHDGPKEDYPGFKAALAPYGATEEIFFCPRERASSASPRVRPGLEPNWGNLDQSSYYYVGGYLVAMLQASAQKRPTIRLAEVAEARFPTLFADVDWTVSDAHGERRTESAHGDFSMVVHVDGHVRAVRNVKP